MLASRADILDTMARFGTRLIVIGRDQVYTDMPEYRNAPNPAYLNERVRGTGGLDVTSFGEENLLNLPFDRYDDESIAVHEFCHTIDAALGRLDPTWRGRLRQTFQAAQTKGLWKNTYAMSNPAEYWGEIAQSYLDCNRINNWNHGPIGTREALQRYDPDGFALARDVFRFTRRTDWRYRPLRRQPSVIPPPARLGLPAMFTKLTLAREFPVVGVARTSDKALLKANDTIRKMLRLPPRHSESPDPRRLPPGRPSPRRQVPRLRAEDAAGFRIRSRRYRRGLRDESIAVVVGMRPPDPAFESRRDKQQYELRVRRLDSVSFDQRLAALYGDARIEKWTQGVAAYFDARHRGDRERLKTADPALFVLLEETFAYTDHPDWRYVR